MALKAVAAPLGSPVGGSGTPDTIPVWSTGTTLTDSIVKQSTVAGTNLLVGGNVSPYATAGRTSLVVDGSTSSLLAFALAGSAGGYINVTPATASFVSVSRPIEIAAGGANQISFTTNSLERMRIASTGAAADSQVAIGTSSFTSGCSLTVTKSIDCSQSAQGLKLPATPGATGAGTEQILDCYQENTWTATDGSGAGLTFTVNNTAVYTRTGRLVHVRVDITFPVTANASNALVALPSGINAITYGASGSAFITGIGMGLVLLNGSGIEFYNSAGSRLTNANLSAARIVLSAVYQAA